MKSLWYTAQWDCCSCFCDPIALPLLFLSSSQWPDFLITEKHKSGRSPFNYGSGASLKVQISFLSIVAVHMVEKFSNR